MRLAGQGGGQALGMGLALCVALITGTGILADTTKLVAIARTPVAALTNSAFLLFFLPILLPRLTAALGGESTPVDPPTPVSPPDEGEKSPVRSKAFPGALTPAEQRVFALLLTKKSYGEIALELHISPNTVKWHARNIYRKIGCSSREELQARFKASGTAPAEPGAEEP